MIPQLPDLVYRVTKRDYAETASIALSGLGGVYSAGRWNSIGKPIVYTAHSSSLCLLERLVHADEWIADQHPDRVILTLALPRISWTAVTADELASREPTWRGEGSPLCRNLGDAWLATLSTCALMVPSAANPIEYNILLNPGHVEFKEIIEANAVLSVSPVALDARVVSLAQARRASGA